MHVRVHTLALLVPLELLFPSAATVIAGLPSAFAVVGLGTVRTSLLHFEKTLRGMEGDKFDGGTVLGGLVGFEGIVLACLTTKPWVDGTEIGIEIVEDLWVERTWTPGLQLAEAKDFARPCYSRSPLRLLPSQIELTVP